jgi:hypothetical protein
VDDSLLFFKGSREGAEALSNFLESYCQASGRRINKEKSSIFFSKRCPQIRRDEVKKYSRHYHRVFKLAVFGDAN